MFVSVNFLKIREVPVFRILKASLKQVPNQVGSYREMNSRDEIHNTEKKFFGQKLEKMYKVKSLEKVGFVNE